MHNDKIDSYLYTNCQPLPNLRGKYKAVFVETNFITSHENITKDAEKNEQSQWITL